MISTTLMVSSLAMITRAYGERIASRLDAQLRRAAVVAEALGAQPRPLDEVFLPGLVHGAQLVHLDHAVRREAAVREQRQREVRRRAGPRAGPCACSGRGRAGSPSGRSRRASPCPRAGRRRARTAGPASSAAVLSIFVSVTMPIVVPGAVEKPVTRRLKGSSISLIAGSTCRSSTMHDEARRTRCPAR